MKSIPFILLAVVFLSSCGLFTKNKNSDLGNPQITSMQTTNDYEQYDVPVIPESDSTKVLTAWRTCSVNEPRLLRTLNSGSKKFVHVITRDNQATAGLFGLGNLSLSKNEKIAIVDYVEYKDTICTPGDGTPDNTTIRLAAGVRLFLKISRSSKKVNVEIPSKIAAGAEFGLAQSTFEIETIGFKNGETRDILSGLGESFDVESYVKIMNAVSQVMKVMRDTLVVNPVRIPFPQK